MKSDCPRLRSVSGSLLQISLFLFAIQVFLLLLHPHSASAREENHVLLLHSYHEGYEWSDSVHGGVVDTLRSAAGLDIRLCVEYLDAMRNPGEAHLDAMETLLRGKYTDKGVAFDVIICTDDNALAFIRKSGDGLFGDVPKVFCGANDFTPNRIAGMANITGVNEAKSVHETLDLIFDLFPDVKTIAAVSGSRLAEKSNHREARRIAARFFQGRAEFLWLNELEPEELQRRLSELDPKTSAVLYLNYFQTPSGKSLLTAEALDLVSKSTGAPVLVTADFLVRNGMLGGKVVHGRSQGEAAARLALRILAGERADDIPVTMESPNQYLFSQEMLEKYGIAASSLPPASLIVSPEGWTMFADWESASRKVFSGYGLFMKNATPALLIDPDSGAIVETNQAARIFYGYSKIQEMNIDQINVLLPDELSAERQKAYREGVRMFEFRHRLADGSMRDVQVITSPVSLAGKDLLMSMIIDETEKIAAREAVKRRDRWIAVIFIAALILQSGAVFFLFRSVERRKRAEKAMKESEENLKALFSSMTEMVAIHDLVFDEDGRPSDYRITSCNRAYTDMTGIQAEDAVGRLGSEVYGTGRAPFLEEYAPVAITGEPRTFETYYPPLDKHFRISIVSPGKNKFATVTADFTDIRRAEAELLHAKGEAERLRYEAESASRAKSAFLANTSHEIRTPLNGVIGFLELLADTSLDDRQREYVDYIRTSSASLLEVVSDVLDISRIEAGELRLEMRPSDVNDIARQALDAVRGTALEKNIDLKFHRDGSIRRLAAVDPARLKQVLVNLLGNAVKFTEKGSVGLSVLASIPKDGMCEYTFSVKDTGAGIPPEIQREIFAPFYQRDGSLTRKHGGTGLGIPICDSILRKMGSRLELESVPGDGSRFFFTLQASCVDQTVPAARKGEDAYPLLPLETKRPAVVLIAEDHKLNRRLLRVIVSKLLPGSVILEAADGREAVEVFTKNAPDIALMDLHMPVMDGPQAAAGIREAEKARGTARTPIIAVTADVLEDTKMACEESGMDGYLAKPLEAAGLRAVLKERLSEILV